MNKRQFKFYWVLLHEYLEREQVESPPNTVAELKEETQRMADHYEDCLHETELSQVKAHAVMLESYEHPTGGGFAFYLNYCFAIGETDGWEVA